MLVKLCLILWYYLIKHKQIADKSNEIPAFQEMLKELDDSYIFTFDAMHTQKKL